MYINVHCCDVILLDQNSILYAFCRVALIRCQTQMKWNKDVMMLFTYFSVWALLSVCPCLIISPTAAETVFFNRWAELFDDCPFCENGNIHYDLQFDVIYLGSLPFLTIQGKCKKLDFCWAFEDGWDLRQTFLHKEVWNAIEGFR